MVSMININSTLGANEFPFGIYIYGAGELGQLAIDYCEACGIKIRGLLDGYKTGTVKSRAGLNYVIASPDSMLAHDYLTVPVAVAVATLPFEPISKSLMDIGWSKVIPFYSLTSQERDGHPLKNGWLIQNMSQEECESVAWIRGNWSDETSLAHYNAFLAWHHDYSELSLVDTPITIHDRYTIAPLLKFFSERNNQVVDVGSHDGAAVKRLNDAGIKFHDYILIEPDTSSRYLLDDVAEKINENGNKVRIIDKVICDFSHKKPFVEGLGYCSQIWNGAIDLKDAISLDELALKPDFIKIHTEGSEWDVLIGAKKTIQTCHPALAFSVYHSRNGFCHDIVESMKTFHNYRWYFRLHSYQGTGAFVYAIPI